MPPITTDRSTSVHRAQIAAEAVVSGYLNEIRPPRRIREEAHVAQEQTEAPPREFARSRLALAARRDLSFLRRRTAPDPCAEAAAT